MSLPRFALREEDRSRISFFFCSRFEGGGGSCQAVRGSIAAQSWVRRSSRGSGGREFSAFSRCAVRKLSSVEGMKFLPYLSRRRRGFLTSLDAEAPGGRNDSSMSIAESETASTTSEYEMMVGVTFNGFSGFSDIWLDTSGSCVASTSKSRLLFLCDSSSAWTRSPKV